MTENIIATVVVLLTAVLPCLVLGYLVAYKNQSNLIAGWDAQKLTNPTKAAKVIGLSLMIMAALLGFITLLWLTQLISDFAFSYTLIAIILIPVLSVTYVRIKFKVD